MAEDARYRVVYEESIRALEDQQHALDDLRARAGILLSAAAISTSFLGGLALHTTSVGPFGWAAIVAFVGSALSISLVLVPRTWVFHVGAQELLSDYLETAPAADINEILRSLAFYRDRRFRTNVRRLARLLTSLRAGSVLLAIEVLMWLLDFAWR